MASSGVLLCVCVALVLCGVVRGDGPLDNRCVSSCAFENEIWDVNTFSNTATVPPGLVDFPFDYYGLDGSSEWYSGCVDDAIEALIGSSRPATFENIINYWKNGVVSNCVACKPSWVYLYDTQFRLLPSNGLVGDITYLSGGYQPTTAAWTNFCSNDYDLPDTTNVTVAIAGADVSVAFTPACYSIVSCSYTQTAEPLQTSHSCTPNDYDDAWPSNDYCRAIYRAPQVNFQIKNGCGGRGCETLKLMAASDIDIPTFARSKFNTHAKRLGRIGAVNTDPYDAVCLATDDSFFSR